jgi:hypothetical protein
MQPAHTVDQDRYCEEPRGQVTADSLLAEDGVAVLGIPVRVLPLVAAHIVYAHLLDDEVDEFEGDARDHGHYDEYKAAYCVYVSRLMFGLTGGVEGVLREPFLLLGGLLLLFLPIRTVLSNVVGKDDERERLSYYEDPLDGVEEEVSIH